MTSRLLALMALTALALSTSRADEIIFTDGTTQEGCEVTDETITTVSFKIPVSDGKFIRQSRPTKEVREVIRSNMPGTLTNGRSLLEAGDHDAAIAQLNQAARSNEDWVKQRAALWLGECYLGKGDGPRAQQAFEGLLEQFPTTRLLAEARLGIVRALLARRDASGARTALQRAQEEIRSKQLGPYWELKARLEGARIGVAAGDWRAALTAFNEVVAGATSYPDLLLEARVGQAQALSETGDAARALTAAQEALAPDTLPDHLAARAWMVVGDCHRKADRKRDAFFAYLRVVVLYSTVPEAPRACWESASCVKTLEAEGGAARAKELTDELKRRWPQSEWNKPLR